MASLKSRISKRRSRRGRRPREGKLARSKVSALRLDPQLRYFLELAARKQHRTLSSYLEWAAAQSLDRIQLTDFEGSPRTIADEIPQLWDVDEAGRFVKLALRHPDLLNYREQVLWKLIRENQYVWPRSDEGRPLANLIIARLSIHWDRFVEVANEKADKAVLPDEAGFVQPPPK